MNNQIRCNFCHELVAAEKWLTHEAEHIKLRADGQHNDYVTLPIDDRYQGSLNGIPQVYEHPLCGSRTGMPDDIIRSYLVDPFLYSGDNSFCTGCHVHIPCSELVWTETGEDLQTYNNRLRSEALQFPDKYPHPNCQQIRDRKQHGTTDLLIFMFGLLVVVFAIASICGMIAGMFG